MEKKLNVGCGDDYREGWVNIDNAAVKKDKRIDLDKFPYPLPDNHFDFVCVRHVLAHIKRESFIKFMKEIHRISKPCAVVHIISPENKLWLDPTFKNPVTLQTFQYFCEDRWANIYELPRFKIIKKRFVSDKIGTIPKLLAYLFPFLNIDCEIYIQPVK